MVFFAKSLRPRPFRARAFTDEIRKELRAQGWIVKRMLEKTVSTWIPRPTFRKTVHIRGNDSSVEVSTTDARFKWVNEGTRIRWAVMSRDWQSKSTPRVIGARAGAGRVAIRGRRAMQQRNIKPRAGIQKREFTKEIMIRRRPYFYQSMREAIRRGKRKAHG